MKKILMVMVLAVLLSTTNLFAECPPECTTCVSGTIVSETWTEAGSPYCVEGDILVAGLTIEPGVRVEFLGDYVFEVAGILTVAGTKTEPVVFTRFDTNEDGWQGIFFNYSSPGSELSYCTIEGSINSGIRIDNSEPIIRNCIIEENIGSNGGGIKVTNTSIFILDSCTVKNNSSTGGNSRIGGGICVYSGETILINCLISDNSISSKDSYGGGVYISGILTMRNCKINNNSATASECCCGCSKSSYGGGLYVGGNLTMSNCVIDGNSVLAIDPCCSGGYGTPYGRGAGVYVNGIFELINSTISNNTASIKYCKGVPGHLVDGPGEGGGVYCVASATSTIMNSIFWENTPNQILGDVTVCYSDIQDGYTGEGNINFNPIFDTCGPLQIVVGSQCIDAGNPDSQYNDVCFPPSLGTERNDMGAHGGPGACGWPDDCPCDLNYDGKCDMQDWLKFGEEWGHTDCNELGVDCECDLNGDGNCDMQDWLCFGEDWGRTDCP